MVDIIVIGDSHLMAMGAPKSRSEEPTYESRSFDGGTLLFYGRQTKAKTREDIDHVAAACRGRSVAILWRGNQHNTYFLFSARSRFDVHVPGQPAVDDLPVVPQAVLRAVFAESLELLPYAVSRWKDAGATDVFILGTPPPKGDEGRLFEVIRASRHFNGLASRVGLTLSDPSDVTPRATRLKLWSLIQIIMAEIAATTGAIFVPVPAAGQEADGSLRADLWGDDVTHAGRAYGDLMTAELIKAARAAEARR